MMRSGANEGSNPSPSRGLTASPASPRPGACGLEPCLSRAPGHDARVDAARHADDLDLARRSAAGDPEAVQRLVEAHGPALAMAAASVLGERTVGGVSAEDVVGETLLSLLEDGGALLEAYRGEARLRTYLAGIARRIALDALRRGPKALLGLPLEGIPGRDRGNPPAMEALGWLPGALARLPERERRVLTLRYVEGLPFRELSRLLEVPLGTAATWAVRGRRRLKALWEAEKMGRRPE